MEWRVLFTHPQVMHNDFGALVVDLAQTQSLQIRQHLGPRAIKKQM